MFRLNTWRLEPITCNQDVMYILLCLEVGQHNLEIMAFVLKGLNIKNTEVHKSRRCKSGKSDIHFQRLKYLMKLC